MLIEELEMIKQIKENVNKYLNHEFLVENLEFAPMQDKQINCLVEILENSDVNNSDVVSIATATVLVQVALDTHDLVKEDDKSDSLLDRQLRILGGDLASGQYYKILADLGCIQLINIISEGIMEINILKLNKINCSNSEELTKINYELDTKLILKIIENYGDLESNKLILEKHFKA